MKAIFVLIAGFVVIGVFSRKFDTRTCLLVLLLAIAMVVYITLR